MRKTKFTYKQWLWTKAEESLYTLDKEQLYMYNLIIDEATKDSNGIPNT